MTSRRQAGDDNITRAHLTSPPREHDVSGILAVDKPSGISSAQALNRLKKIPGIHKIGHSGTLDPAASGLLICPVNRATRLARFFTAGVKIYEAGMILGVETDTQDAEGNITKRASVDHVTDPRIRDVCREFEGEIHQVPPVFSALKHQGKPLYAYARKGAPVTKAARKVSVYHIRIQEIRLPLVRFEAACSAGTYIRTLCADIGARLGCGGHLQSLRRIACGGFAIDEAAPLDTLTAFPSLAAMEQRLVPMADALRTLPVVTVDAALADRIRHGKILVAGDLGFGPGPRQGPPVVSLCDESRRLLAVAEADRDGTRYNYCCVFVNP